MLDDLREYLEKVDEFGECKVVEGADMNLEIGHISELSISVPESPLLLFEKIKGYPPGYRVVTNISTSYRRAALTLGIPAELKGIERVRAWKDKILGFKPVPPEEVNTGPIKENIIVGKDIDLFEFPTPKWHHYDGGRYISTGVWLYKEIQTPSG